MRVGPEQYEAALSRPYAREMDFTGRPMKGMANASAFSDLDTDGDGWGNNELQYYTDQNATVADGLLTITARKESVEPGFQYTSARLRSLYKGDWTYGRMEMRARMPVGKGMWPAFWMLPSDRGYGGWAASGEIDITIKRKRTFRIVALIALTFVALRGSNPLPLSTSALTVARCGVNVYLTLSMVPVSSQHCSWR